MEAIANADIDLRLHERQGDALLSAATEILFGGAAGGGKSHLMRVAAIAWCVAIPGLNVYLFRRTFPDLKKNHMTGPTSLPMLLASWLIRKIVKYNQKDNEFIFWNGSRIILCHCQYESDLINYQGAEIHVLLLDEITHWTEPMYQYLRARVRLGGLKVPEQYKDTFPRILCSGNPGGIGHTWVKLAFVDFQPAMHITRTPKSEGGMLRQYIPSRLADNPTMEENDPGYKDRLAGLGSPSMVKAWLEGDWNIVAGGMFDDVFDSNIHMIEPFAIPPAWQITRAFDWGSSKPFSVGWWALANGTPCYNSEGKIWTPPPKTLIRIGEWYGWNGKPNQGAKISDSEIAVGIIRRQKEMGIHLRTVPGPADNSIFDEINNDSPSRIQERHQVRWVHSDKSPGSRVRGWQIMRERFINARNRNGLPGIYAFSTCVHFKRTIPVLPRDLKKPDDVDTDSEDHVGDETRYMCAHSGVRAAMTTSIGAATNG